MGIPTPMTVGVEGDTCTQFFFLKNCRSGAGERTRTSTSLGLPSDGGSWRTCGPAGLGPLGKGTCW